MNRNRAYAFGRIPNRQYWKLPNSRGTGGKYKMPCTVNWLYDADLAMVRAAKRDFRGMRIYYLESLDPPRYSQEGLK